MYVILDQISITYIDLPMNKLTFYLADYWLLPNMVVSKFIDVVYIVLCVFICILCIAQGNVLIFQKNYYYLKKKIAETKIGRVNIMY